MYRCHFQCFLNDIVCKRIHKKLRSIWTCDQLHDNFGGVFSRLDKELLDNITRVFVARKCCKLPLKTLQ